MISKRWKPPYQKTQPSYYAHHDIDMHKDEIIGQMKYWHVENMKYVIPNNNVKRGEINILNYKNKKIFILDKEFTVNNTENYVNEFGIAMNPDDCNDFKYSIVEVK